MRQLICFNVDSLFHGQNSEKEKKQVREYGEKSNNSSGEQRGKDKDACCVVFPLIKIDFLRLNPAGLHQVSCGREAVNAELQQLHFSFSPSIPPLFFVISYHG